MKKDNWPHLIKAVIFDNDGLLLDTEPLYALAHKQITGIDLSMDVKMKLMGRKPLDYAIHIIDEYKIQMTPDEYLSQRDEYAHKIFPSAKLFPGAQEIVDKLIQKGVPFALATSANIGNLEPKMSGHPEFYQKFNIIVTGDDVENGKPHPDIFLLTMKKLGLDNPLNILVFEDSPNGIKAANNAGMAVVQVPDPDLPLPSANSEIKAEPTLILKSLLDFSFDFFQW